jgi:hypothetical protein
MSSYYLYSKYRVIQSFKEVVGEIIWSRKMQIKFLQIFHHFQDDDNLS